MTGILLLLGLGLALIIAEVLLPSGGILGTLAALCVIGSLVWAFQEGGDIALRTVCVALVAVPAVTFVGLKILPHSPLTRRLVAGGFSFDDGGEADEDDRSLVGREGVVEAPLRPVGTARFDGKRVDVVSRGELIESGVRVRVLEARANRVLVARAPGTPDAPDAPAPHPPESPAPRTASHPQNDRGAPSPRESESSAQHPEGT